MTRAALIVVLLGLVACSSGKPASVASTTAWRPLAASTLSRTEVAAARVGRFVYVMGGFERGSGATSAVT